MPSDKDKDKDPSDKEPPVKPNKGPDHKPPPSSPGGNKKPEQKEKKENLHRPPRGDLPDAVVKNKQPVKVKDVIPDDSSVVEEQVASQYFQIQLKQLYKNLESTEKLAQINSQYDQIVVNIKEEIEMLNRVNAARVPPPPAFLEPKKPR